MRNFLSPAITLLNRLKYMQKFLLIFGLLMLSVGLTVYLLVADINKGIDAAKIEKQGLEYNYGIRILLEHLQQYRGLSNAILNGEVTFNEKLLKKQKQVNEDIFHIDQMDQQVAIRLKTKGKWNQIKDKWDNLETKGIMHDTFNLHTAIIADLLSYIIYIGNTSQLKLDRTPDSYYLMDILVNKLPLVIETTGQLRGLGAGIAAKKALTSDEKIQLVILSGMVKSAINDLKNQNYIFSEAKLDDLLQPNIEQYFAATKSFLDMLQTEMIDSNAIQLPPAAYYEIATIAMDNGFKLYDIASPSLGDLLEERIHQLSNKKYITIGFSAAFIFLNFILFLAFYESVISSVFTLKQASARFAVGDLSARVELHTQDELQHVGMAFNNMADAFGNMIAERKRYEETIKYQAFHDTLTDLPNRALLNIRLSHALLNARMHKQLLAVLFLDLDRFKIINDTLGHEKGDLLLKEVANRLRRCFDQEDIVFRMGGDEFLFFFSDVRSIEEVEVMTNQILKSLTKPITTLSNEFFVSTSIGISLYPKDGEDIETLVKNADVAMYAAKKNGRNNYRYYNFEMNDKAADYLLLENNLRRALERGEFILYYQPRIDLITNQVTCMEALIRWQHPTLGLISPADFIPKAEELGLIIPIGEWVLNSACQQNKIWHDAGYHTLRVSVNISASQIQDNRFLNTVITALENYSLHSSYLELELTESVIMENGIIAIDKMNKLKKIGVQMSIDDFGTGFSSLSYLKYFPINSLKIDRSFVKDVPLYPKDVAITKTIIDLGRRLNLKVVAEGVETKEQLSFLISRRCSEFQGFLISQPLPPEEAIGLIKADMTLKNINDFAF